MNSAIATAWSIAKGVLVIGAAVYLVVNWQTPVLAFFVAVFALALALNLETRVIRIEARVAELIRKLNRPGGS